VPKIKKKGLYINENLTQARKRLLWLTKQDAKKLKYDYVWTMNGKVYIRKDESSDCISLFIVKMI